MMTWKAKHQTRRVEGCVGVTPKYQNATDCDDDESNEASGGSGKASLSKLRAPGHRGLAHFLLEPSASCPTGCPRALLLLRRPGCARPSALPPHFFQPAAPCQACLPLCLAALLLVLGHLALVAVAGCQVRPLAWLGPSKLLAGELRAAEKQEGSLLAFSTGRHARQAAHSSALPPCALPCSQHQAAHSPPGRLPAALRWLAGWLALASPQHARLMTIMQKVAARWLRRTQSVTPPAAGACQLERAAGGGQPPAQAASSLAPRPWCLQDGESKAQLLSMQLGSSLLQPP